jgi:glycosyltransferase involved in cell wall biosynthesis
VGAGPEPLILVVAGLGPIKGINYVLDALALVREAGQPFSCVVCGKGPDREALEAQAARLGLAASVSFRGRVPRSEIPQYFAAADILVHGSLIEGSGNVLLEALASGLPVVCTDAGGPAEYVRDGVTGFVVPVADSTSMAERILTLLRDPELRAQFGRRGHEQAQEEFSYDRMIADTLHLYQLMLAGGTSPSQPVGNGLAELRHTSASHIGGGN